MYSILWNKINADNTSQKAEKIHGLIIDVIINIIARVHFI